MCFSLEWVERLCIFIVLAMGAWAIIKLFLPLLGNAPGGAIVAQILTIVLWVVIAIFVIIVIFGLLSCLLGSGGFSLMPHR